MKRLMLGLTLSFLVLIQTAYAKDGYNDHKNDLNKIMHSQSKHWYIDLGFGWVFHQSIRDTYVPRNPVSDRYIANKVQNNIVESVSLGYLWSHPKAWLPYISAGLEYSHIPSSKITGTVQEFSLPGFETNSCQYKLEHSSLILVGKLNLYRWKRCMPYISLGLGNVWNKSSDYQENPLTQQIRISPTFSDKTKLEFMYTAGLGLDFMINKSIFLGLGYRYDNFFKNETGNGIRNFSDKKITSRSHINSIMLSARYLFA